MSDDAHHRIDPAGLSRFVADWVRRYPQRWETLRREGTLDSKGAPALYDEPLAAKYYRGGPHSTPTVAGDTVYFAGAEWTDNYQGNPLNDHSLNEVLPQLEARGVTLHGARHERRSQ